MQSQYPDPTILEVKRFVESSRRSELQLNANGGNSILIVCDPMDEVLYIRSLRTHMPIDKYLIIDLIDVLNDFVSTQKDDIDDLFELLQSEPNQIFKAGATEDRTDLFKSILSLISDAYVNQKIPILINTGALYGAGIDNIQLIENEVIMKGHLPLLILYPATKEGDMLLFLGKRPASKYRCMIIQ